ncbi:proline-rich protein 2-like [Panthera leo]|uniref:proline-rich protein 2-like n=1 Tax=Panthera leo TaxID=9689 RepID=UPI001C69495D|nr:proline-rich protein 2-like [Panthera leo]
MALSTGVPVVDTHNGATDSTVSPHSLPRWPLSWVLSPLAANIQPLPPRGHCPEGSHLALSAPFLGRPPTTSSGHTDFKPCLHPRTSGPLQRVSSGLGPPSGCTQSLLAGRCSPVLPASMPPLPPPFPEIGPQPRGSRAGNPARGVPSCF